MKVKGLFYVWMFCMVFLLSVVKNGNAGESHYGMEAVNATDGVSYFTDGFESGLGNWTVSGWDWGLATSTYRGGSYSVTDSPSGNYADNTNASLTLAGSIDLTGSTSPVLTFWHKYNLAYGDYIYVEISTDGGFEWSSLSSWYNTTTSTWQLAQIDLSSYKTFNNVKIRFRLYESNISEADGWHIDDMEIKEKGTPTPTTTTTTTTSSTTTTTTSTTTTTLTSDTTAPSGSISINSGATYTKQIPLPCLFQQRMTRV